MYAITGITGKVGGVLARTLLAGGHSVRAVVRDAGKGRTWAEKGCEVSHAEMEDATALAAAFKGTDGGEEHGVRLSFLNNLTATLHSFLHRRMPFDLGEIMGSNLELDS